MIIRYQDISGSIGSASVIDGITDRAGRTVMAGPIPMTLTEPNLYEATVTGPVAGQDYFYGVNSQPKYTAILVGDLLAPVFAGFTDASLYFDSKLHTEVWSDLADEDQARLLIEATRAVDNLSFLYGKYDSGQPLEWPRGSALIPGPIREATLEVALALADGQSVERQVNSLRVTSRRFAGVSTTYGPGSVSPNVEAGIVSITAWKLLQPYLRQPGAIRLYRAS